MLVKTTVKRSSFYNALTKWSRRITYSNGWILPFDLSFVNELLADRYCMNFGRPAKEPEMMLRIQILKYLYNLSIEKPLLAW